MRRNHLLAGKASLAALLVAAFAVPARAAAQDAAPPLQENPHSARFKDVERGFFIGFDAGYLRFLNTPTADPAAYPYAGKSGGAAGGTLVAVELGRDLTPHLAVSLFAQGGNQRANVSYGAFTVLAGGADVRFAFYGRKDRNDWERLLLYVHARGGYARTLTIAPNDDRAARYEALERTARRAGVGLWGACPDAALWADGRST